MRGGPFAICTLSLAAILSAAGGDGLPGGKGRDVVLRMCSPCHGVEKVTGANYSKKQWTSVVYDMVSPGAADTEEDANLAIGYLTRNFGLPVNINTSTAQEIETGLSFPAKQAESLVRYRTARGAFKTYKELLKVPGLDTKLLEEQRKNILF